MTWAEDNIRPASWRGMPFKVRSEDSDFSRATAVHSYPKRETVWVEDLGGGSNSFTVAGFLAGDDVLKQQQEMIAVCRKSGPGELVHPTLGVMKVVCVAFGTSTRWDAGRVVELKFGFVAAGERLYPTARRDTPAKVTAEADNLDQASKEAFVGDTKDPLTKGLPAKVSVAGVVNGWARTAVAVVSDAARVVRAVGALVAPAGFTLGRYARGWRIGLNAGYTTVGQAIGAANAARGAVVTVASLVNRLGAGL